MVAHNNLYLQVLKLLAVSWNTHKCVLVGQALKEALSAKACISQVLMPISCLDYVQWTSALERYNWRDLPEWEIWPIKSMTGWYLLFHPLFLLPKFSCATANINIKKSPGDLPG